ncbi:MAG: hypothetical protein RLO04_05280 [Limnobacter sp.]|uniref:hypothetical protein n=1 Tax=Limnobacter sp. TaxID=2003368 RepID=UPI0032F01A2F
MNLPLGDSERGIRLVAHTGFTKLHFYLLRFKGLVIEGVGRYEGYSVKLFYLDPMKGILGRTVKQGEVIGAAQDLTIKYSGITNHIHFEITFKGTQIDPSRFLEKEESCKA